MFTSTDSLRPVSVLLVVDDSPHRSAVLDLLLAETAQLTVVDSPEEAEARFADTVPDIVFAVHSPTHNAFDLVRRLRTRWGCRAHCAIIGGDDDRAGWKQALVLGVCDYLPLPLDGSALREALRRVRDQVQLCHDTSRQLVDASRLMQVFDMLPWGVVLIGAGERIIRANRMADTFFGLSGRPAPQTVEEAATALFGPGNAEPFTQLRAALHTGQSWHETVFLGQKFLAVQLSMPQSGDIHQETSPFGIMTLLDIGQSLPSGAASRPALAAAAFDLLLSRHLPPRELGHLTELITDGALPVSEPFELEQLLDECREGACQQCSNPVSISVTLADQVPAHVNGHPLILKETLRSLLEWAGRESGNGSVTLNVALQARQNSSFALRFTIAAVERRLTRSSYRRSEEFIIDEFGRSGNSALKQVRGIGLATILTARLGSSLILRNVAREGKTASFDLWVTRSESVPAAAPAAPLSAPPSEQASATPARQEDTFLIWDTVSVTPADQGGLRILVAEDNPLEQRSLESVLTKLGHSVVMVNNGRVAVEEFELNRFDLVLLDILMPVMDGFEAVRLIREREQRMGSHTPVLALTSYTLKAVQERCSRAGMNGYLAKPVTTEKAGLLLKQLSAPPAQTAAPEQSVTTGDSVLNYAELEYDKSLYREMVDLFMTHALPLFDELEQELATGASQEAVHEMAHKLKGMAANIGAQEMRALLGRLEDATSGTSSADSGHFLHEVRQARGLLVERLNAINWDAYRQPE